MDAWLSNPRVPVEVRTDRFGSTVDALWNGNTLTLNGGARECRSLRKAFAADPVTLPAALWSAATRPLSAAIAAGLMPTGPQQHLLKAVVARLLVATSLAQRDIFLSESPLATYMDRYGISTVPATDSLSLYGQLQETLTASRSFGVELELDLSSGEVTILPQPDRPNGVAAAPRGGDLDPILSLPDGGSDGPIRILDDKEARHWNVDGFFYPVTGRAPTLRTDVPLRWFPEVFDQGQAQCGNDVVIRIPSAPAGGTEVARWRLAGASAPLEPGRLPVGDCEVDGFDLPVGFAEVTELGERFLDSLTSHEIQDAVDAASEMAKAARSVPGLTRMSADSVGIVVAALGDDPSRWNVDLTAVGWWTVVCALVYRRVTGWPYGAAGEALARLIGGAERVEAEDAVIPPTETWVLWLGALSERRRSMRWAADAIRRARLSPHRAHLGARGLHRAGLGEDSLPSGTALAILTAEQLGQAAEEQGLVRSGSKSTLIRRLTEGIDGVSGHAILDRHRPKGGAVWQVEPWHSVPLAAMSPSLLDALAATET